MTKQERLNILAENLTVFRARANMALEERRLALHHVVAELCLDCEDSSIESLSNAYKRLLPKLDGGEELLLYEQLTYSPDTLKKMESDFAIGSASVEAGSHGRVACVKNDFNNAALERFSELFSLSKPSFVATFSDACERVVDGECEFGIIPIENMGDGKMLGFYSMIDRYELKIRYVCDIEDEQGDAVRYALVSRGCPEPIQKMKSTVLTFEFSILAENGSFMSRLLSATESCGGLLSSFDCSPVQYDNRLKRYLLTFRIKGRDALPLRAFLALNYPSYTPIGLYPEPIQNDT